MTVRPALAIIDRSDAEDRPARSEAIAFARHLARRDFARMMAREKDDSAPRT
jgi:hypothetical protein